MVQPISRLISQIDCLCLRVRTIWHSVGIYQMNQVNCHNGCAMTTALNKLFSIIIIIIITINKCNLRTSQ